MGRLSDQSHCLVTGASRGIGLGVVEALLGDDGVAQVYALSRDPSGSESLHRLRERHGDRLELIAGDLTREDDIAGAAQRVGRDSEELHFVFNVAGVLHDDATGLEPEKSLRDIDPEHLRQSFAVNSIAPIVMAKHFHHFLRHDRRSVWANMSARVGSIGDNHLGGWYGYRASKAAQNMFTRTMAIEMGRKAPNAIVVALHPGTVDTRLSEPFQRNVPDAQLFDVDRAVEQLLEVVDDLKPQDSGGFFAWDGAVIEW